MSRKYSEVHAGEVWAINNKRIRGHKAIIRKKQKNGKIFVEPTTHSSKTRNIKNYALNANIDPNDNTQSYLLKRLKIVEIKDIGKHYTTHKITNKVDKSISRKLVNNVKKRDRGYRECYTNSYIAQTISLV